MSTSAGKKQQVYGDDAIMIEGAISRQATKHVSNTGSDFVDGVISGLAWKGGTLTYAFPDKKGDYDYRDAPNSSHLDRIPEQGFGEVSSKIKAAAQFILDTSYGGKANDGFAVEGFTNLHISRGSDTKASVRYGESSYQNPTSFAFYPSAGDWGGDVWFGPSNNDNSNAVPGNYEYATVIHETGHALGLKHGHESSSGHPAIPSQWDSLEYSVMTYNSFVGDDAAGYKNEEFGFPQTFMMADIAALQHMYGANFDVNDGRTIYTWKPGSNSTWVNGKVALDPGGDNIFATIWDGGGQDRYDLSAYNNNLYVDLRPGAYSIFKSSQLADLDASSKNKNHIADGNIYNALLYKGNTQSLIEDAIGGSGNDSLTGNAAANHLQGKVGNDRFYGFSGNDTYEGGGGNDVFFFKAGWDDDTVGDLSGGDKINLTSFNLGDINDVKALATDSGSNVIIDFGSGDTLMIKGVHVADLQSNDFVL